MDFIWNMLFLKSLCPPPNISFAMAFRPKVKRNALQGVPLTPQVSFCVCMGLALGSMSCRFWFCLSWFKDGFACTAPTVLLVHWSTNLWRSSVKVPFLLLLLLACTWTCIVVCGRGSGYATRLFVEDPKISWKGKNQLYAYIKTYFFSFQYIYYNSWCFWNCYMFNQLAASSEEHFFASKMVFQ